MSRSVRPRFSLLSPILNSWTSTLPELSVSWFLKTSSITPSGRVRKNSRITERTASAWPPTFLPAAMACEDCLRDLPSPIRSSLVRVASRAVAGRVAAPGAASIVRTRSEPTAGTMAGPISSMVGRSKSGRNALSGTISFFFGMGAVIGRVELCVEPGSVSQSSIDRSVVCDCRSVIPIRGTPPLILLTEGAAVPGRPFDSKYRVRADAESFLRASALATSRRLVAPVSARWRAECTRGLTARTGGSVGAPIATERTGAS